MLLVAEAQHLLDSFKIVRKADKHGINTIVARPDRMKNHYENPKQQIMARVEELDHALIQEKIDLKILPRQETRIYGAMVGGYKGGNMPGVDGYKGGNMPAINHS
jgi:protein-tyrosine phosphatase